MKKKAICAECGAETAFVDLHDPELQKQLCCDQCNCLLGGCCGLCGSECRGLAWPKNPKNYTLIYPRWPV
jgi:hypothetical protein